MNEDDKISQHNTESMLFNALDAESKGYLLKKDIIDALESSGVSLKDPRLNSVKESIESLAESHKIDFHNFVLFSKSNLALINNIITRQLIIPDFKDFCEDIKNIYDKTFENKGGEVATYIPQLGRVNPKQFAVSVCTVDGQVFSIGDVREPFCIQSVSKTITYCMAQKEHGEQEVHKYIGKEPSGVGFNVIALDKNNLPHNPFINSGAIVACSLLRPDLDSADRFDYVMNIWNEACGGIRPGYNNAVFLSEKRTGDRNYALGHFMQEKHIFPPGVNLSEIIEFYFQCCSIEVTSDAMAIAAATLANNGICPVTEKKVFDPRHARNCRALMYTCGMYDYSGEFAFDVGLPAKSGVSGVIILLVPHVMGISIWSPRIDVMGNSVRGVAFCKEFVKRFNFSSKEEPGKKNPLLRKNESLLVDSVSLIIAASQGDLNEVKRLVAKGVDINATNFDGRTALHVAASDGQEHVVEYLIHKKANTSIVDRWGGTALSNAVKFKHERVIEMLDRKKKRIS